MRKLLLFMILLFIIPTGALAATASYTQPPIDEIKEIITEKALDYDIPPEILKAIAFTETGYQQFVNGEPNITDDGGIGIMQVTPNNIDIPVDIERLKYDIEYNIETAARVLDSKWDLPYLPKMNNESKDVLENWYFPVMAYNGLSKVNDPNLYPTSSYQERVFKRVAGSSFIYRNESEPFFEFPEFDIRYEDGDNTMKFPPGSEYTTDTITHSQQMHVAGDVVYVDDRDGSVKLRSATNINSVIGVLIPFTPATIVGTPVESSSIDNDFNYYHVRGVTANGYTSSAYLNKGNDEYTFSDPITDERAAALYYLAMNGYITGFQDGSFGSEQPLRREHVAVILDRILDMSMPSNYRMIADDVSTNNEYYQQLAEAEYNGYLGNGGKLRPKEYLSRSQMASVLVRGFDEYYEEPTRDHVFQDQHALWNYEPINKLYHNQVTVADPFRPNENVTRSQFALFIYRTMVNY